MFDCKFHFRASLVANFVGSIEKVVGGFIGAVNCASQGYDGVRWWWGSKDKSVTGVGLQAEVGVVVGEAVVIGVIGSTFYR